MHHLLQDLAVVMIVLLSGIAMVGSLSAGEMGVTIGKPEIFLVTTLVVGIERAGATIINPGPDEEIQAGDQVLLLGSQTQLTAARRYLSPEQ